MSATVDRCWYCNAVVTDENRRHHEMTAEGFSPCTLYEPRELSGNVALDYQPPPCSECGRLRLAMQEALRSLEQDRGNELLNVVRCARILSEALEQETTT